MPAPDILQALRQATGEAHARLDADIRLDERIRNPHERRDLVARFHRFHAGAEALFAATLAQVDGLDLPGRAKTARLAADLDALGARPSSLDPRPPNATRSEALGWLYVVEGSTLGGRVIDRTLLSTGVDRTGLSFLDPYGSAVGERWREVIHVLEREVASGQLKQEEILTGARAAFAYAYLVLVKDPHDRDGDRTEPGRPV